MDRSESLLSRGKETTCREEGKGKREVDLSLYFPQAPGDFLIDFQGYVSNLFFRYRGLANELACQCFSNYFPKFSPEWTVCIGPGWPPSHLLFWLCSFAPDSRLDKKGGGGITPEKACMSKQDACGDNIDPWLPLKHLLCLTDFSSFGL